MWNTCYQQDCSLKVNGKGHLGLALAWGGIKIGQGAVSNMLRALPSPYTLAEKQVPCSELSIIYYWADTELHFSQLHPLLFFRYHRETAILSSSLQLYSTFAITSCLKVWETPSPCLHTPRFEDNRIISHSYIYADPKDLNNTFQSADTHIDSPTRTNTHGAAIRHQK